MQLNSEYLFGLALHNSMLLNFKAGHFLLLPLPVAEKSKILQKFSLNVPKDPGYIVLFIFFIRDLFGVLCA